MEEKEVVGEEAVLEAWLLVEAFDELFPGDEFVLILLVLRLLVL